MEGAWHGLEASAMAIQPHLPSSFFNLPSSMPENPYAVLTEYQRSSVLMAAGRNGVFVFLHEHGPTTAADVARGCGISEIGAVALLRALASNQFIDATEDTPRRFSLNAFSQPFAQTGAGGLRRIVEKEAIFYGLWSRLDEVIKTGDAQLPTLSERLEQKPELVATFLAALNDIAQTAAPGVLTALKLDGSERILDFGCGGGGYSAAIAQSQPRVSITALDLPQIISLTRKYLGEQGVSERVRLVDGDFHGDIADLDVRSFDLVLVSHILHDFRPDQLASVLTSATRYVRTGGRLAVLDVLADEGHEYPVEALFGLMMILENPGGRTHERSAILDAASASGLKLTSEEKLYFGSMLIFQHESAD